MACNGDTFTSLFLLKRQYFFIFMIIQYHHYHHGVLPDGRSFTANAGTKVTVPSKGRSSTANSETKIEFLLGINRCGSFQLRSAPHSLYNIWRDLKRSEKISGTPMWRWGEWIWLTGPSELHWNSPQGLNISSIRVFDQIKDSEIPITLRLLSYRRRLKFLRVILKTLTVI